MNRIELRPFADDQLDAAAVLLAAAHETHRAAEPLLAPADARAEVERAWSKDDTSGIVALRDGEPVAYLFAREAESPTWGRHAFVDRAGHAGGDPELVRDLWAAASEGWWQRGARRFFANVPSTRDRLDPWERLGFAQMHQEAIRATDAEPVAVDGVAIRRGGLDDIEVAMRIGREIGLTQSRPPSYHELVPESRQDWVETLEDPEVAWFVAERDGQPLGHATLYEPDPDLGTPSDTIFLASTATLAEARGLGAGVALLTHALAWAAGEGYATMWTNWRVTNLLASRYWPARGFRSTYVRLHRVPGIA